MTPVDFYCDSILPGLVPFKKVAETDQVLAFHHTQPYWPLHIVVIPKRHIPSLAAVSPEDLPVVQEMMTVAAAICRDVTESHGGCRISSNCGDHQTTKHLHFYIHSGQRLRDEHGVPIPQNHG